MPRIEPDFENVHASTPVWPKGLYELRIDKVTGMAYDREDEKTGKVTHVVAATLRPKLVGVYDSNGKLKTELDGSEISDQPVENIRLYIHSQGAREFSKRIMMAIFGYTKNEEEEYNKFVKDLDLSVNTEEREDGQGYDVTLGGGWTAMEGKNVKAQMSKGSYKNKDDVDVERQDFDFFVPVGAEVKKGRK